MRHRQKLIYWYCRFKQLVITGKLARRLVFSCDLNEVYVSEWVGVVDREGEIVPSHRTLYIIKWKDSFRKYCLEKGWSFTKGSTAWIKILKTPSPPYKMLTPKKITSPRICYSQYQQNATKPCYSCTVLVYSHYLQQTTSCLTAISQTLPEFPCIVAGTLWLAFPACSRQKKIISERNTLQPQKIQDYPWYGTKHSISEMFHSHQNDSCLECPRERHQRE